MVARPLPESPDVTAVSREIGILVATLGRLRGVGEGPEEQKPGRSRAL